MRIQKIRTYRILMELEENTVHTSSTQQNNNNKGKSGNSMDAVENSNFCPLRMLLLVKT